MQIQPLLQPHGFIVYGTGSSRLRMASDSVNVDWCGHISGHVTLDDAELCRTVLTQTNYQQDYVYKPNPESGPPFHVAQGNTYPSGDTITNAPGKCMAYLRIVSLAPPAPVPKRRTSAHT